MLTISDSSPIIGLSMINRLYLLRKLYNEIIIPTAVYQEITEAGDHAPGSREVKESNWIKVKPLVNTALASQLPKKLDRGESEAIALSLELFADLLVIDERRGRNVAKLMGLNIVGVGGILVKAKEAGLASEVKPLIDELINGTPFRISKAVVARTLELAGES
jgi:predicted nucleic acid-binding protein